MILPPKFTHLILQLFEGNIWGEGGGVKTKESLDYRHYRHFPHPNLTSFYLPKITT